MSQEINFEKSLSELEVIVKKLEDESCSLEEAMTLFEKGIIITKNCSKYLNDTKLKIETLTEFGVKSDD